MKSKSGLFIAIDIDANVIIMLIKHGKLLEMVSFYCKLQHLEMYNMTLFNYNLYIEINIYV